MSIHRFINHPVFRRLQGEYVLPGARVLYLAVAGGAVCIAILGIVAALLFEFGAHRAATHRPVPQITEQAPQIDFAALDGQFLPPRDIQALSLKFTRPITADTPLVYFEALSPSGIAGYPDDLLILGGPDAARFERHAVNVGGTMRSALAPTQALADELNADPERARTFQLRVAMKGRNGLVSEPAMVRLSVAGPDAPAPVMESSAPAAASQLERLAQRIALFADPHKTTEYFQAYAVALREPSQCGAGQGDGVFVTEYGRAFDHLRTRLTPESLPAFYGRVCDAWRAALQTRQQQRMAQADEQARIVADNFAQDARVRLLAVAARAAQVAALGFVAAALAVFMLTCLFLAFLAMEGHTKAVREVVEALGGDRLGAPPSGAAK